MCPTFCQLKLGPDSSTILRSRPSLDKISWTCLVKLGDFDRIVQARIRRMFCDAGRRCQISPMLMPFWGQMRVKFDQVGPNFDAEAEFSQKPGQRPQATEKGDQVSDVHDIPFVFRLRLWPCEADLEGCDRFRRRKFKDRIGRSRSRHNGVWLQSGCERCSSCKLLAERTSRRPWTTPSSTSYRELHPQTHPTYCSEKREQHVPSGAPGAPL